GLLGVVVVAQDPSADAPDHRAVAADDRLEDRLLPPLHEAFQELPVRQAAERAHLEEDLKVTDRPIHPPSLIPSPAGRPRRPPPAYYRVGSVLIHFFSPPSPEAPGSPRRDRRRPFGSCSTVPPEVAPRDGRRQLRALTPFLLSSPQFFR